MKLDWTLIAILYQPNSFQTVTWINQIVPLACSNPSLDTNLLFCICQKKNNNQHIKMMIVVDNLNVFRKAYKCQLISYFKQ